MKKYKIKTYSNSVAIIGTLLVIAILTLLLYTLFIKTEDFFISMGVSAISFTLLLIALIQTAKVVVEFQISDTGLNITWIKSTIFQSRSHQFLKWNEIKEFTFREISGSFSFTLMLKNDERVTFSNGKEDLHEFFLAFEEKINSIPASGEDCSATPKFINFYTTKRALYLAYISAIALMLVAGFLVYVLFFYKNHSGARIPLFSALAAIIPLAIFVAKVVRNRKEDREII